MIERVINAEMMATRNTKKHKDGESVIVTFRDTNNQICAWIEFNIIQSTAGDTNSI